MTETSTAAQPSRLSSRLQVLVADAERASAGGRRDGEVERPLGPKAARTRDAILMAAVAVFCEQGYAQTSTPDIHTRAGVSLGTLYQYFRDKRDLITTIAGISVLDAAETVFTSFDAANESGGLTEMVDRFVRNYAKSADYQRMWEEVTVIEPTVARLRNQVTELLELSVAESITRAQRSGRVDDRVDAAIAARSLTAMVDRTCYLTFVVDGRGRRAVPDLIDNLTVLWANALRLGDE